MNCKKARVFLSLNKKSVWKIFSFYISLLSFTCFYDYSFHSLKFLEKIHSSKLTKEGHIIIIKMLHKGSMFSPFNIFLFDEIWESRNINSHDIFSLNMYIYPYTGSRSRSEMNRFLNNFQHVLSFLVSFSFQFIRNSRGDRSSSWNIFFVVNHFIQSEAKKKEK